MRNEKEKLGEKNAQDNDRDSEKNHGENGQEGTRRTDFPQLRCYQKADSVWGRNSLDRKSVV